MKKFLIYQRNPKLFLVRWRHFLNIDRSVFSASDPKPRLRKDAVSRYDFVDKLVLPENPTLNAKYDGPSNNLRSKESKRVLMRAMIILVS